MEDIQEEIQEFAEEAEIIQRSKMADEQDKFLDDSFGTNLEFSRLIQNNEQIIEDKQDIDITEALLMNLQQPNISMDAVLNDSFG